MKIRPLQLGDAPAAKAFSDLTIGVDYYSVADWQQIYHRSLKLGRQCTLILEDEAGKIRGIRVTYPHGQWQNGKGDGLSPQAWGVPFADVAYFQSIFIDSALTGQGWGGKMSSQAIELLRALGAKAIVTHSWKESPGNSSRRYLQALGFQLVATHGLYWHKVDYFCTRCGKPCMCTAEEMILKLEDQQ